MRCEEMRNETRSNEKTKQELRSRPNEKHNERMKQ